MSRFSRKQRRQLEEIIKKTGNKANMSVKDREKRENKITIDRREDTNLTEATRTFIEIEKVIPGLNGKTGLIRESHHPATERKKKMKDLVCLLTRNKHIGPVRIIFTRYTVELMDWDNMCASFKNVGDALVFARVIEDDKPAVVVEFLPKQVKVPKYDMQKSTVEIISINKNQEDA